MTKLPGYPFIQYQHNQLCVDGVNAQDLAQRFGTPLYVYSKKALLHTVEDYQNALQEHKHLICYAVKANSNIAILQILAQAGCGFDIVSGGELERVLAAGAKADQVVFSGVGKTPQELRFALQSKIKCFNVESVAELDVLAEIAAEMRQKAPISLRINPDVDAKTHPYISTGLKNNKFGIAFDQALQTYLQAKAHPWLEIVGVDCHIGSQITQAQPFFDALERLIVLITQLKQHEITLKHLDLGGGLGIVYQDETLPDLHQLYGEVIKRIHEHGFDQLELLVEPGRSIVGNAGILITQALYLKSGETKNFCIVDAAFNDLARPAMYEAYHAIVQTQISGSENPALLYDIVGPICESSDWLGRDRQLSVKQGDFLAILSAGAYGMSMASNYNTRPRGAEVLVDGDVIHLIRERESTKSLFADEHLITPL